MSYSGGAPVGYPMSSLSPVTGGTLVETHHRLVIMVIPYLGDSGFGLGSCKAESFITTLVIS